MALHSFICSDFARMSIFDAIVLGTGGIGSAARSRQCWRAAGPTVLGLDQFPPAHDRGSSHGRTRIIRQAYFEHLDYVPLVAAFHELWHEQGERAGERLFQETGPVAGRPRPRVPWYAAYSLAPPSMA